MNNVILVVLILFSIGRDVLARGRTGSGKTGAFPLPAIQKVLNLKSSSGATGLATFVAYLFHHFFGSMLVIVLEEYQGPWICILLFGDVLPGLQMQSV